MPLQKHQAPPSWEALAVGNRQRWVAASTGACSLGAMGLLTRCRPLVSLPRCLGQQVRGNSSEGSARLPRLHPQWMH